MAARLRRRRNATGLYVSVNVAGDDLLSDDYAIRVSEALATSGLPATALRLEITESAPIRDLDAAVEALDRLRAVGVGLSIDDFGTGYSSLSYQQRLGTDTLKIDRAFVRNVDVEPRDAAIVRAAAAVAHALNMKVVAEGVETRAQLDRLEEIGCDYGQGYYFSKPAGEGEAAALLRKRRGLTVWGSASD